MTRVRIAIALLALVFGSLGTAQAIAAPIQTIELHSFAYNPTPIHLQSGKAVTLHFVNRAGKGHDFTARNFFAASRILAGRVTDGEIDLGPGQAKSVTLIPARGIYKVHCGHPFHKMLGMKSTIIVR